MKKRILPLILCVCMLLSALAVGVLAAEGGNGEYTAKIMEAYGGANGIVSMTFDDGDWDTNVWLDQMFDKYDLYGSTMAVVQSNYENKTTGEPDVAKITKWQNLFANGRLEPESHSYTHLVLPDEKWATSNQASNPTARENNTEENYQIELVNSQKLIKEYLGYDAICLAPSNNTLSDGAMAVVMDTYYAVRQGSRFQSVEKVQSLDPTPGSSAQGGWYNLSMLGFYDNNHAAVNNTMPAAVEYISQNGGWVVTMCHGIRENSGDATYAEAEALFKTLSQYQKEGSVWVTTFGKATRYIRERQNSTVSYNYTSDKVTVSVTMAQRTADDLPLTASIFNHPLTVRIELPNGVEQVKYTMSGSARFADTFTESGKTYAYVDVIPNSGEIEIERVAKGGIFSADDFAAAITNDGEYKLAGNLTLDETANLTVSADDVTIDLGGNTITFVGDNTITVPSGSSLTLKNGTVKVAYSYQTESKKGFGSYKPITGSEGSYAIGSAVSSESIIAEADKYQTISSPAFTVTGGNLSLNGISLERGVAVSNDGELLSIKAGAVTLKDSKLCDTEGVMSWANAQTRLIYMERKTTPTKLTVQGSTIEMALPNSYYNGTLISADGPSKINASTGAITSEGNIIDTNDNILICYIAGSLEGAGVEILIEDSVVNTYHRGFRSENAYASTDSLTMRDSRMKVTAKAGFKGRAFEFLSADLLFENCYLDLSDNAFYLTDTEVCTTSITMKQCYVLGQHVIQSAGVNNEIYFEDCYIESGLLRWRGYNDSSEAGAAKSPVIKIAGTFATKCPVASVRPVCGTETWGFKEDLSDRNTTTLNYWWGLTRVDGLELNVQTTAPDWFFTVKHADGTTDIIALGDTPVLSATDKIYLWKTNNTTPISVTSDDVIEVKSFGVVSYILLNGKGSFLVDDGTFGSITVRNADGSQIYYLNDTTKTLEATLPTLTNGQTLVLHADQQIKGTTQNNNLIGAYPKAKQTVAIDLNGYTVYHAQMNESLLRMQPLFGVTRAEEKLYIYSSKPGARLLNAYTLNADGTGGNDIARAGIMFDVTNGTIALGYDINGEKCGENIQLVGGQLLTLNSGTFLADNTAWYSTAADNSAVIAIYGNSGDGRTLYISNSTIYHRSFNRMIVYRNMTTNIANVTFEDCNIYNYNNSKLFLQEHTTGTLKVAQTVYLKNTNVYNIKLGATDMMRIQLDGNCKINEPLSEYVTMAPGNSVEEKTGVASVSGTSYPNGGVYGNKIMTNTNATYAYKCVITSAQSYEKTLYTNVSLDTALDVNLYVPVDATLTKVTVDGVETLDREAIQTINGKDYYIIKISKAPKAAFSVSDILLTYGSKTYYLQQSLVNYANSLLYTDEEKYTGATLEYLVDSKEMMLYVLNYAKEAIERYGDLEGDALAAALAPIDKLLDGFTLSAEDTTLEDVKTDLPTGIGAAAAFDLDTTVGFVLGVYNTFTGTVSIRLDDVEVTKSFTAYEAAAPEIGADNVLTLENIYAYQLYSKDIEITVEGTNGDTPVDVTFTYNLATYAQSGVSGDVGTALYAYAKEAYAYGRKYSVGTIE